MQGGSREPETNSIEQGFLVASVHWNAAPNHGTAIVDAMEALIAVGLPFCTAPTLQTYASQRAFNEASWRVTKRNLAAGRLRWLMFGDPATGTFQVTWQGKAGLPVASLSVVWPTVRRAEPLYSRWYFGAEGFEYAQREDGAQGAFGGDAPFHYLSDVELDEGAITWFVNWGDASQDGYHDLLRRLDGFAISHGVNVIRLEVQP
jgi:hypothetical protein